jgi:small-conductance mechanosensitive channel
MQDALKGFYPNFTLHHDPLINSAANVLIILLLGLASWWVLNFIVSRLERRKENSPFLKASENIFTLIKKAGHSVIYLMVGAGLINFIHAPVIERIFYALMVIVIASFADSLVKDLLPYLEQRLASKTSTKIDDVIFDLLKRFSTVIIYVTAIILALDVFGVNIMPFVAGAGVAGIAIGFAAKDTLSNIIAGVLLLIDRPFEVGDRIEVWSAPTNSATWGDVLDVGLRATRIKTTDNIIIVIPNNEIMKRDIINYTTITNEIRVRIPVGIAYDADVKRAKEIICGVSLELEWTMKEPAPKVVVKTFGDSAVNLEARVWITDPRKRMDTISYITDRVKEEFQKGGIEIPYPKRDIYIKREVQANQESLNRK